MSGENISALQLARTTEGRLNDYVTTTPLRLSVNNNHGRDRTSGLAKIKGEWERDRLRGGGEREAHFMEIIEVACLWLCCRVKKLKFTHPLYYPLSYRPKKKKKIPLKRAHIWLFVCNVNAHNQGLLSAQLTPQ